MFGATHAFRFPERGVFKKEIEKGKSSRRRSLEEAERKRVARERGNKGKRQFRKRKEHGSTAMKMLIPARKWFGRVLDVNEISLTSRRERKHVHVFAPRATVIDQSVYGLDLPVRAVPRVRERVTMDGPLSRLLSHFALFMTPSSRDQTPLRRSKSTEDTV